MACLRLLPLCSRAPVVPKSKATAVALSRRDALCLLATLPLLSARRAAAAEANPLGEGQPVRPAFPAAAYVRQLRSKKGDTFASLHSFLLDGDYSGLSNSLVLSPFDDLRQACYYLPWALVTESEPAATQLQEAYIALRGRWKGLDDAALAAARFQADDADVRAAVAAFREALEQYEKLIPASLN